MKKHTLLIFVLFVALLIRVIGTVPGHNYYHPDEPMSYDSAMTMIMHGDINPRRFDYPAGVPLVHTVIYQNIILPPVMFLLFVRHPAALGTAIMNGPQVFWDKYAAQVFGRQELSALYWSRVITAILGFLSVYITYKIASALFSETAGVVAAAFLAVNYRHVLSSHLTLSDIPNALFALLSFYTIVLLFQKNTWQRYVSAAIAIGISLSMKYQIYPLFSFFFVQGLWAIKKWSLGELFGRRFILSIVVIAAIFVVMNPYLFFNFGKTITAIHMVSTRYQAGILKFNPYPAFFLYLWGIGIMPSLAIIIGFLFAVITFPFATLFLLTYIGPFLFTFLYYLGGGTYVRNFTTVIPFLCIFAGVFLTSLGSWIKRYVGISFSQTALVGLAFLFSLGPIQDSVALDVAYLKPWTRDQLAQWVMNNVPNNSDIVNDNTAVPSYLTKPLNLISWTRDIGNSMTALMTQHRDFAILNVNWNQMYFFPWFTLPFTQLFSYTDIPYPLLRETYHGLLLSEYFDYTVYEAYKSYQAPDDAYLVIKPPQMPESRGREIRVFRFVQGLDGWKFLDLRKGIRETGIVWNQTAGNENLGSLELSGSKVDFNFTRAVSPFITASPGNVYTVMGYAKTGEVRDANEKDGFFRIDFYPDARDELLRGSSLRVAVSDALFGSDSWTKEEIITTAPPGTRYLAISFQRSNPKVSSRYWLDDIRIFESSQPLKDRFPQIPYLHPTMPDNILYPNSIY